MEPKKRPRQQRQHQRPCLLTRWFTPIRRVRLQIRLQRIICRRSASARQGRRSMPSTNTSLCHLPLCCKAARGGGQKWTVRKMAGGYQRLCLRRKRLFAVYGFGSVGFVLCLELTCVLFYSVVIACYMVALCFNNSLICNPGNIGHRRLYRICSWKIAIIKTP